VLFNSWHYALFLGIVLLAYYPMPHRLQNALLLIASYVFYAFWDWRFLGLLLLVTALGFCGGKAIEIASSPGSRKAWLSLSVAGALGVLALFKYHGFFIENLSRAAALLGLHLNPPALYLLLPVGVSFYVFQAISYTADVYRGQLAATDDLLSFGLYMAFFPKLLAGPIERASRFLPQVEAQRRVTPEQVQGGLALIVLGLFKKVAIADPLSAFIDPAFLRPDLFSTPELIRAALFFTLQIYCDFSAYTDLARGSSRLLGFELMENFRQPYLSVTITQFWRRWHISLSSWLRDYVYIPLGGNRRGRVRTYLNLMITMLLGGLWHGAGWNYVIWGGLHGFALAAHRLIAGDHRRADRARSRTAGAVVLTVLSVFGTFVVRAWGLNAALEYIRQLLSFRGMDEMPSILLSIANPWIPVLALDLWQSRWQAELFFLNWGPWARGILYAAMIAGIVVGGGSRAPFIYTQF
jgi:alginate O-acetyltransferase complex protein AlgI